MASAKTTFTNNESHPSQASGYLRGVGKNGRALRVRQKRWFKLDGAVFSKHPGERSLAAWEINLEGAEVIRSGKTHFSVIVPELESTISKDFSDRRITLAAKTEEECCVWIVALKQASRRKLEEYYEVGQLIGEGGFAKVRLGTCLRTNELRAIKTMEKVSSYSKVQGTEVSIIKRVQHPNIVKTYDIFETERVIHIVMEYMEGGMLYNAIERGIRFGESDIILLMKELIDGLLYLHNMGIVHRDMKPENVLCTSKRAPLHVKIADFGLSSVSSISELKRDRMLMSTLIGTPEFVAPEIARQEEYTEKVDLWALGMLCYNVIAGQLPLDDSQDILHQLKEGIPLSFPEPEWKNFSSKAQSFIRSLICLQPEKRLSPLGCLVHPWLDSANITLSTRFTAHGRLSTIRFSTSKELALGAESRNLRRMWKIYFLAVSAFCRLGKGANAWPTTSKWAEPEMKLAFGPTSEVYDSKATISDRGHLLFVTGDSDLHTGIPLVQNSEVQRRSEGVNLTSENVGATPCPTLQLKEAISQETQQGWVCPAEPRENVPVPTPQKFPSRLSASVEMPTTNGADNGMHSHFDLLDKKGRHGLVEQKKPEDELENVTHYWDSPSTIGWSLKFQWSSANAGHHSHRPQDKVPLGMKLRRALNGDSSHIRPAPEISELRANLTFHSDEDLIEAAPTGLRNVPALGAPTSRNIKSANLPQRHNLRHKIFSSLRLENSSLARVNSIMRKILRRTDVKDHHHTPDSRVCVVSRIDVSDAFCSEPDQVESNEAVVGSAHRDDNFSETGTEDSERNTKVDRWSYQRRRSSAPRSPLGREAEGSPQRIHSRKWSERRITTAKGSEAYLKHLFIDAVASPTTPHPGRGS